MLMFVKRDHGQLARCSEKLSCGWQPSRWNLDPSRGSPFLTRTASVPPEISKPVGCHLGVPDRVLDVLVPEVVLQGPRIVTIVGELEAAGMAQHVRMDGKGDLGSLAEPGNEMVEAERAHRPATLGNEDVGLAGVIAPELAQSTDFIAPDRVHAWYAAFGAANVQPALIKLDLMP
jgi:hypothetical protein